MRRRNCIMVLVCSRRDTKPWPGFYLRTFTPHHRSLPSPSATSTSASIHLPPSLSLVFSVSLFLISFHASFVIPIFILFLLSLSFYLRTLLLLLLFSRRFPQFNVTLLFFFFYFWSLEDCQASSIIISDIPILNIEVIFLLKFWKNIYFYMYIYISRTELRKTPGI